MPYWQLFYHFIWATKNRQPLLTPEVEPIIFDFLRTKALGLEANVYALNGYLDHVHMVASIPPKIGLSKFIGQVKAVASVRYNQATPNREPFYWQEEFGVFSFDRKRLPNFVAYVQRQKEHHEQQTLIPILEQNLADYNVREATFVYGSEGTDWWREMLGEG